MRSVAIVFAMAVISTTASAAAAGPVHAGRPGGADGAAPPPSIHAAEAMAHEDDRLTFSPGSRVEVPLAGRPAPMRGGVGPTPGAVGSALRSAPTLRRAVFGFLPYWAMDSSDLRLDYPGLSTIAIFGVQAGRDGHLATHYSTGRPTSGWAAWWSARASQIMTDAHRAGTRVVLTVQRFAWTPGQVRDTEVLLSSPVARQRLAGEIVDAIEDRGADGGEP